MVLGGLSTFSGGTWTLRERSFFGKSKALVTSFRCNLVNVLSACLFGDSEPNECCSYSAFFRCLLSVKYHALVRWQLLRPFSFRVLCLMLSCCFASSMKVSQTLGHPAKPGVDFDGAHLDMAISVVLSSQALFISLQGKSVHSSSLSFPKKQLIKNCKTHRSSQVISGVVSGFCEK